MIWPLTGEAQRLEEEKRLRRQRELREVSGRIKKLSEDIITALKQPNGLNGHGPNGHAQEDET